MIGKKHTCKGDIKTNQCLDRVYVNAKNIMQIAPYVIIKSYCQGRFGMVQEYAWIQTQYSVIKQHTLTIQIFCMFTAAHSCSDLITLSCGSRTM